MGLRIRTNKQELIVSIPAYSAVAHYWGYRKTAMASRVFGNIKT